MEQKVKNKEQNKGRPSKYDPLYHDAQTFSYSARGYTNAHIATKFGIDPRTFDLWLNKHDSLRESALDGRAVSNSKSEYKLHKMAHGYYQDVIEVKVVGNKIKKVKYPKWIAPSFSALRFEMINKMPHLYRDKVEEEPKEEQDTQIEIIVKKANG